MAGRFARFFLMFVVAAAAFLPGCGGDEKGSLYDGLDPDSKTFYAFNFSDNSYYPIRVDRVGEGVHCYVYLERGQVIDNADTRIPALIAEFDNVIYPTVTNRFGSEPNPGADGDPKLHIVLTNIPQSPVGSGVGGYFSPVNEYSHARYTASNQKEMFFVDVGEVNLYFYSLCRLLAHEFQHMVHWEQKERIGGRTDDTWLNEAMSEAAEIYCYGLSTGNASTYAQNPQDSLTGWNSQVVTDVRDYASVGMWSQYLIDRIPDGGSPDNNVFRRAMRSQEVGAASIDNALLPLGKTFSGVFTDWTIANLFTAIWDEGLLDYLRSSGHPEWTYLPNYDLEVRFYSYLMAADNSTFVSLPAFSSVYAYYNPVSGSTGSVTWKPFSAANTTASFVDSGGGLFYDAIDPDVVYPYTTYGFLAVRNPTIQDVSTGDNVVFAAPAGRASSSAVARYLAGVRPKARVPVSLPPPEIRKGGVGLGIFSEEERRMRAQGLRPEF